MMTVAWGEIDRNRRKAVEKKIEGASAKGLIGPLTRDKQHEDYSVGKGARQEV
jgi:hypothetical protein